MTNETVCPHWEIMEIDYSAILKADRIRRNAAAASGTVLSKSENDRGRILFSPAFRRLRQEMHGFSVNANATIGSNFSHCLQVSQIGRVIANRIATQLAAGNFVDANQSAALVNFVDSACLLRNIGNPPFGRAGKAAIQRWFVERGADMVRAACKSYGGREITASDPRLVQALTDFYEFDGNPQGLRVIAKLKWSTEPNGLNLTKTTIASYLKYLRMAGAEPAPSERFTEKAGFFSTEAGLLKSIWSEFGYSAAAPQRFPLAYIVEAAEKIGGCLCDLEDAIETQVLRQREAIAAVRESWLSSYIPTDPDPVDDQIVGIFNDGVNGKNRAGEEFGYADFRAALISALSDYAARRYLDQHDAAFNGKLDSLLPSESGAGAILAALKDYCKQHVYRHPLVQQNELSGYATIYGLLQHFALLLTCSTERFQAALDATLDRDRYGVSLFAEQKLLSLIPDEYIGVYSHAVAQIGNAGGRDAEFEEWNTRAHLVVDFVAGMTDAFAVSTYRTLAGLHL